MVRNRNPEIGEATVNPSQRASQGSPIPRILVRIPRYIHGYIGNYVNYSEPRDTTLTNGTKKRNEINSQTNRTGY